MTCSKAQMVAGLQDFIKEDIIPGIQDKPLKMALYAAIQFPGMIETVLDKPALKIFLKEDHGVYNLEQIHQVVGNTLDHFGSFPLTINPIPFILPSMIQISLNRSDLESLFTHIERMGSNG